MFEAARAGLRMPGVTVISISKSAHLFATEVIAHFRHPQKASRLVGVPAIAICLLTTTPARGQSPAGPTLAAASDSMGQYAESVVVLPDGGAALTWEEAPLLGVTAASKLFFQSFDVLDHPHAPFRVARNPQGYAGFGGFLAANQSGALLIGLQGWRLSARRYGFPTGPKNVKLDSTRRYFPRGLGGLSMDSSGAFVAAWLSRGQESADRLDEGIYARLVNPEGLPVGPEIHVNTVTRGEQTFPSVSMAADTGAFAVVWQTNPIGQGVQVAGQLFAPDGTRIGTEFRVGATVPGYWLPHAKVAMAPDGSFVVVWEEPNPSDGSTYRILGQRFAADGVRRGPRLWVSEGMRGIQQFPSVACDPNGNFVVTWNDDGGRGVTMARLYHANGTPVRAPVALTDEILQENAVVAFGWNGTFAIAWTDLYLQPGIAHVRRFSASPGEEICQYQDGEFDCYTGRQAVPPLSIRHPFGGRPGDIALLGDIDGDGRADPCLFRSGVFLCDTEHDSGTTGVAVPFGEPGDVPFLADVNGDGKADPCVYRDGHFLCDTGHVGVADVDIAFGAAGDIPLMGDIDGDGKADPCVFRAGTFLCDTHHDGVADISITFGQAGDAVLLGDFDGDGRADPCIFVRAELQCDTAHDGGETAPRVQLEGAHLTPIFGNLDGL